MEKPFKATGLLHCRHQDGRGTVLAVGSQDYLCRFGIVYDVSIKEHVPVEIIEVANRDRAMSGSHYKVLHADGTPLDPEAEVFVLRPDNDEVAREAMSFYLTQLRLRHAESRLPVLETERANLQTQLNQALAELAEFRRQQNQEVSQ